MDYTSTNDILVATPEMQGKARNSGAAFTDNNKPTPPTGTDRREWAHYWYDVGFRVIPIIPNEKRSTVKWTPWLADLSSAQIESHWRTHPDHDVGFIVDEGLLVLDADGPESMTALTQIEMEHGAPPLLINKTRRGEHHFFRLAPGTFVKSDAHDTEAFPDRLDVKARMSLVILPPSGPREIDSRNINHRDDLDEVDQAFVDAIFLHNGRETPRPRESAATYIADDRELPELGILSRLLDHIDPGCGYQDWVQVLMGLHHETAGSDEGLELADAWSRRAANYGGRDDVEVKWRSFEKGSARPVTIGTLILRAKANGGDMDAIMADAGEQFTVLPIELEIVERSPHAASTYSSSILAQDIVIGKGDSVATAGDEERASDRPSASDTQEDTIVHEVDRKHPLTRYSLLGDSALLEAELVDPLPVLGLIALLGQLTLIFAETGVGKTLTTLYLLTQGIDGLDPSKVHYVNVDDNANGLHEKLLIAEAHGFHMLSEGHRNFRASDLITILSELTDNGKVDGVVVILDTLTKFVDVIDKKAVRALMIEARRFVQAGGTFIALGHVNKNKAGNGQPVYAGTADLLNDADSAWMLQEACLLKDSNERVVAFTKRKGRHASQPERLGFAYAYGQQLPYAELLKSVRPVDDALLDDIRAEVQAITNETLIAAVRGCIAEGINSKMKLATTAAKRAGASRRTIEALLDRYAGDDPAQHHWHCVTGGPRGAFLYELHGPVKSASEGGEAGGG